MKQNSKTLDVSLNMVGTIIGAGIFGLPAVIAETGYLGGSLLFFGILAVALALHLLFVQVVLRDRQKRRLAGYAGKWIGGAGYWFTLFVYSFKCAGAILAYIILGGEFLSVLARGIGIYDAVWFWQLFFWTIGSAIVFFGLKLVTKVEDELTWFLIGAMVFTVVVLMPFFDWVGLGSWGSGSYVQALGVMFFSAAALTIIPEAVDIAGRSETTSKSGVIWGTLLAGALSWAFGMSIALANPGIKSAAEISLTFPPIFWWLIPLVGILAVITSFITVTQAFKNLLNLDAKLNPNISWALAVLVPLGLYFLSDKNFLSTIGFVGGVMTGLAGIIVCVCAWSIFRNKKAEGSLVWKWLPLPLVLLLAALVLQELWLYAKIS